MTDVVTDPSGVMDAGGRQTMLAPQEVQKMLALQAQGWGAKRISNELGSRAALRAGAVGCAAVLMSSINKWRALEYKHRSVARLLIVRVEPVRPLPTISLPR